MRRSILLFASCLALSACGSSSNAGQAYAPNTPPPPASWAARPDLCAVDAPWALQILGRSPDNTEVKRRDAMRRSRVWGPVEAKSEAIQGGAFASLNEFGAVHVVGEEQYDWDEKAGFPRARVVILRGAAGRDPRTLGAFGQPPAYGEPVRLPSGISEYPPNPAAHSEPDPGNVLYVFPDGTWVRVEAWMRDRFRTAFATAPTPPGASPPDPRVAWELCGTYGLQGATTEEVEPDKMMGLGWTFVPGARRAVLRFLADQDADVEVVWAYPDAPTAARAEAQVRARCAAGQCPGYIGGAVDGWSVRYRVRYPDTAIDEIRRKYQ